MRSKTAVLLVDVQNDYLRRTDLVPDTAVVQNKTRELLEAARAHNWPVIHIRTAVARDGSNAMPHLRDGRRLVCIEGTEGYEPPAPLAPLEGEPVFHKRFYSGFEDADLLAALRNWGIDTVVVAGLYTHACVRSTVLDAYASGLDVFVPTDCVASYDARHAQMTLGWLNGRAAKCLSSREILDLHSAGSFATARPAEAPVWQHRNPVDWSEILDEVVLARECEIDSAISETTRCQEDWQRLPPEVRADRVAAWSEMLSKNRARWVEALIREVGKPRIDAEGEVSYGLALLAEVCELLRADAKPEPGHVRYRPHGLVALVTPWNNPFAIPIGKIAPALGYGNGVVWKPALPASALSQALMDCLVEAGMGEAISLVSGDGLSGELLIRRPEIKAVSFTGSVSVGRKLARLCGQISRPLQAELGGNNAAIVLADIDIESVSRELAEAMFSFAGQRCTAIRRLIVAREIFERFAEALRAAVAALKVGLPSEKGTQVGPVISKARQSELLAIVARDLASGARTLTGGKSPADCPERGCWVAPTVLTDLSPVMDSWREELFGPVIGLMAARDFDHAIALHNAGNYGLLGALFTHDPRLQARFLNRAEAGILAINQARPAFSRSGPFVGWKASGYGVPEHGRWNRDFYTRAQAAYVGK